MVNRSADLQIVTSGLFETPLTECHLKSSRLSAQAALRLRVTSSVAIAAACLGQSFSARSGFEQPLYRTRSYA